MLSRLKRRNRPTLSWRSIILGLIVIVSVVLFFIVRARGSGVSDRVSVIVATSPMIVWSWNTTDNTFIVLTAHSDDVIDALYGYGHYSLEALWRLGFMDKKEGVLLSDSFSDTLGLPIGWYIGTKSQTLPGVSDVLEYGRSLFSLSNIFSFIGGGYQSNMPIGLFVAFSRAVAGARPDKIHTVDLTTLSVVSDELLPDGTTRKIISPDFLDHALGGMFENDLLRKEGSSVALYNTTSVPALGNRASRMLTNSGILVVTVGNDEPMISQCELIGNTQSLSSKTAVYILSVFGCKKIVSKDTTRADLTIRLGSDYSKRFEALKKQP